MLISTAPRLFRFLLLLAVRPVGCIAPALRTWFTSLWRSILTLARHTPGQCQIRLHANTNPAVDDNPTREPPRSSGPEKVEEESRGTLAALPARRTANWRDNLRIHQSLISSHQFKFNPFPATPETGSQRYRPRRVGRRDGPSRIPAGQQTLLSALPPLPDGWTRHVHPEGNVLFYHEELRIFTESDIILHEKEVLFYATTLIQQATETDGVVLDELTEIVLNVDNDGQWYGRTSILTCKGSGDTVISDIWLRPGTGMLLLAAFQYIAFDMESRTHCEYYPHNRTLPKGVFEDLRGMLNYAKTDMMTADSSTSPFTQDELVAILDLVNSLKDDNQISNSHSIWVIARIKAFFTEDQFLNFCGQPCARLNADTPLFGHQTWNRSFLFKVVNLFLLKSPNEHAVRLQRVWVDGIIIQPRWKNLINRLTTELGRYTIFSTVMLAVNFSFLAVPGVASPGSVVQILIYCSVVSTIGSIVFSLALLNVYSNPQLMGASPAAQVMRTLSQKNWGMACFAVTHSLPDACLTWSIMLFSTALAVQIFSPKEHSTVATLSVECGILVSFWIISMRVIWLFSVDDDIYDVDDSAENDPLPTGPHPDVEQSSME